MSKVVSDVYFLSRFPRFMLGQNRLWRMEESYTLVHVDDLPDALKMVPMQVEAPRCYEAFAAALPGDVTAWPCLYVHRYNRPEARGGVEIDGKQARDAAQLVGSVPVVARRLADRVSLRHFHRYSGGGTNRFDVPPLF